MCLACVIGACTVKPPAAAPTTSSSSSASVRAITTSNAAAIAAALAFLTRFMDSDGRVVRKDQGGDTVSEGQAYAMLLAVAIGDRTRFDLAWSWARAHLHRQDSLLSWHWANGHVVDPQSAADADVDTAWALTLASKRFGNSAYLAAARAITTDVLREETVPYGGGTLLVAGPWARANPATVDPSYLSPRAFSSLGNHALETAATTAVTRLVASAPHLPPDWATLGNGTLRASGSPGSGSPPQFGYDAVRVPIWFATSCSQADRRLAAAMWPFLRRGLTGTLDAVYTLQGRPLANYPSSESLVAAAAAARAADDQAATNTLLAKAEALDKASPRYYASALIALGRVLLTTSLLGACP